MVERVTPLVSALTLEENGVVEVALAQGDADLGDADLAALDRGTNLGLAGGELIQWGRAERLGGGRWRLTRLLRGRRGTEVVPATVGAGFAVLEPSRIRTIDLPMAAIGREVRVIASGVGDADPAEARLLITGASVRPPSPVLLYLYQQGATATLQWVRRSRAGWPWTDGVDAPVGEEAERYRATLIGTATRDVLTTAPTVQFPVAERATLTRIEVRQRGTWAESAPGVLIKGDGL